MSDPASRRTPLYAQSQALKARFVDFAGWEMAVQYQGIRQEHEAVRTHQGMFDISHMGKFHLVGDRVMAALQKLVPTDLSQLQPGQAQYTVLLNDQAGIIDDLIIYDRGLNSAGHEQVRLIVNAATTLKDWQWLQHQLADTGITLVDESPDYALIAVQGPHVVATLQAIAGMDLNQIPRFGHADTTLAEMPVFMARTGYTGEDGFEVMVAADQAADLWQAFLDLQIPPCGLGARDTLRLEAAMALYGQDITDATTPLEAGLKWLVHLDRIGDGIGRSPLQAQLKHGVDRRLVGLEMQGRNIARHDYPILHQGEPVGIVTSGTLSPTLGIPIALGYVSAHLAKVGQALDVEIRGKTYPAIVVKRPFYRAKSSS